MGLLNYITQNIYVQMDNISYNKNSKCVRFDLLIFKDKSKKEFFASKNFIVTGRTYYRRINGFSETPPANAKNGEMWITKPNSSGVWKNRDNTIAIKEQNAWSFCGITPHEIFFYLPTQKFCQLENSTIMDVNPSKIEDVIWWDSWFSPEVINSEKTNLHKQIYLYLKQIPEFKDTIDS